MKDRIERKRLTILRVLNNQTKATSSSELTDILAGEGYDISERTIRYDLLALDKEGFTRYERKQGRVITEKGKAELLKARVHEKLGFLSAKINQMTYGMSFNLQKKTGTVVLNISYLKKSHMADAAPLISRVYEKKFSMGNLIKIFESGEQAGPIKIPEGYLGIGTVCSITLNGILLSQGIPVLSRFGGLLEVQNNKPLRFVEIISYDGTTIDPLEIFIKSGMTDYLGATSTGNGLIGASFREIPSDARDLVINLASRLENCGLGGFYEIGQPSQPLKDIPVSDGNIGAIVIGGLNPLAIVEERGIEVESHALSVLWNYEDLAHYSILKKYIK